MGRDARRALGLVCIMMLAPLSGCFGEDGDSGPIGENDIVVTPETLIGGIFQGLTISADRDLSAFVPYLMMNPDTGFVQNSTVVNLKAGENVLLTVLAPPRTDTAVVLLGDYQRENWPIRNLDESWKTWYERGGYADVNSQGVASIAGENGSLNTIQPSESNGGEATPLILSIERPMAPAYSEADGGRHSTGVVNGRTTFNYLSSLSDTTADPTDVVDGALGYLDRWAGQGLSLIHI